LRQLRSLLHRAVDAKRHRSTCAARSAGRRDQGFSLIEALVALLVLAAIAGIVFELLRGQFDLANRVERKASEVLSTTLERERLRIVVERLVPGWPEDPATLFVGDAKRFGGRTAAAVRSPEATLSKFSLEIVEASGTLVYRDGSAELILARVGTAAAFSYLDTGGQWHPRWPPPSAAANDDRTLNRFAPPPPLPAAVRMQFLDGSELDWLALVGWQSPAIPRDRDVLGLNQ
jgi:prepilin-type N-terminal cleavage/methylation domain-containing protein